MVLLRRDLMLSFRRRAEAVNPLLFFVLVVSLFPLGVSPEPRLLQEMAPGVIWVAALLSAMLSLESIFRSDFEDGALEQLVLSGHPVSVLVLAKIAAHWLVSGLPLVLISPLLAALMGLSSAATGILLITLLLGTPVLSLIGAIGVALTVGLPRGGVILSLLVLPLYVPVLIFSSDAVQMAAGGLPVTPQILILCGILSGALALAPLPTAAALKVSLS